MWPGAAGNGQQRTLNRRPISDQDIGRTASSVSGPAKPLGLPRWYCPPALASVPARLSRPSARAAWARSSSERARVRGAPRAYGARGGSGPRAPRAWEFLSMSMTEQGVDVTRLGHGQPPYGRESTPCPLRQDSVQSLHWKRKANASPHRGKSDCGGAIPSGARRSFNSPRVTGRLGCAPTRSCRSLSSDDHERGGALQAEGFQRHQIEATDRGPPVAVGTVPAHQVGSRPHRHAIRELTHQAPAAIVDSH